MDVICSYQGSFSPPTLGHEDAARIIGKKLLELYQTSKNIRLLFMPTSNVGSKDSISYKKASEGVGDEYSDYVSEKERLDMLKILCKKLNEEFKNEKRIHFEASDLEFNQKKLGTSTIHTIRELHSSKSTLVLAMGEDNGRQIPWWSDVQEYPNLIDKLIFVDREPPVDAIHISELKYKESYNLEKQFMRFDKGWSIELNGEKRAYEFPEIMKSPDTKISDALRKLSNITYLLKSPLPVSSTKLRQALRTKNMKEAESIAGKEVLEYVLSHKICIRTKNEVKKILDNIGGKRKHRKTSKKRKGKKKFTIKRVA